MMNKQDSILPDSLKIFDHMVAFDLAAKSVIDSIAVEKVLVYLIDQVDARALPLLAQQFDVLGYKGWRLANTEADRRALIKKAIELHRYKGTKWAVSEALKSIGFNDIKIVEHVNGNWARFSLVVDNESVVITSESFADIIAMVEEYKSQRSYLDSILMKFTVNDEIDVEEDGAYVVEPVPADDTVSLTGNLLYDGTADYDGTFDHSGDNDFVTITEV